jgi:hypothetical protein
MRAGRGHFRPVFPEKSSQTRSRGAGRKAMSGLLDQACFVPLLRESGSHRLSQLPRAAVLPDLSSRRVVPVKVHPPDAVEYLDERPGWLLCL